MTYVSSRRFVTFKRIEDFKEPGFTLELSKGDDYDMVSDVDGLSSSCPHVHGCCQTSGDESIDAGAPAWTILRPMHFTSCAPCNSLQVTAALAMYLKLDDPAKLRLTMYNNYTHGPNKLPMKYRCEV